MDTHFAIAIGTKTATAPAVAQREPDHVEEAVPVPAPRAVFVSDALLEPLIVAARDRRAADFNSRVPIVSLLIVAVLLCVAWLV
jgi:hypothetical protein